MSGRSRNHGGGVSVEAGKHINLNDGWFIEPLVQVSMLYVAADSYSLDNGLRVEASDGLSTQLRAGTRTGRKLQLANGMRLQPYPKAGWVKDFSSQKTIQTNGISSRPHDSGGKWYAGGGMSGELNRGHQVYVEVETSEGSAIDRPWAVSLGYRVNW